jgi:hypothetical protein
MPLMPQPLAPLLELSSPIARSHPAQVWEQRPGPREAFQNGGDLLTEPDQRGLDRGLAARLQFFAGVADRPLSPVDVLGQEKSSVRLGRARVPEQLVKVTSLRIQLARNNGGVLLVCDGALLPV